MPVFSTAARDDSPVCEKRSYLPLPLLTLRLLVNGVGMQGARTARQERHRQGGPGWPAGSRHVVRVLGAVLGAVLAAGCEARFVDPYPADLVLLPRELVVKVEDAPMVYGLVFDLNLPDATECSRVKARLTSTLRAALLPSGRTGLEMVAQDLSPGCVQTGSRRLSLTAYDQQLRQAETRYGAGRVRPLLLYFNNVELPPPYLLQSDFLTLKNQGTNAPVMWALGPNKATQGMGFDLIRPWTYNGDPRLTSQLEDAARTQFPLVQYPQPPVEGFPLFTAEELSWALQFKGCTRASTLSGVNFTYGPQATVVSRATPPRMRITLPAQQPPRPRNQLTDMVTRFEVEVCRDNCERTFEPPPDGQPVVWNKTPACLLKGVP